MLSFAEFMTKKYVEWQASSGKRKTLDEFSAYIGVSRPLLSMWLNGKKRPGKENIKILAEIFGSEIYDVLSIPRPDPDLERLKNIWKFIPENDRRKLAEQGEKYAAKNQEPARSDQKLSEAPS